MHDQPSDKLSPTVIAYRREAILNRITSNPIAAQYQSHIQHPNAHNTQPWHAVGERMHAAALCAMASTDLNIDVWGLKSEHPSWRAQVCLEIAERIESAAAYLWADPIERLADAAPLPKHVVSASVMPYPAMFWSRETCYVMRGGLTETNWIAVFEDATGVLIVSDVMDVEHSDGPVTKMNITISQIPYKATWPTDFATADAAERGSAEKILKRCAFLASPYIDKQGVRMQRHHRRQLERSGEPREKVEEAVNVVKLRHAVKKIKKPEGETTGVDWKHKWWVAGHYRAQWYPTDAAHRVIWIAPFLKGPPDAPLLEKIYAVVR